MALALISLLLLTPRPPSLLDHLDVLGEDLSRTERELGDLQRQKDILSLEVAQLESLLAANRLEFSRTRKLFQQRIIAISKMQSGARIALLGRAGSLDEFLQTRKLLRAIARHDGRLQDKHTREFQRMSTISTRISQKQGALEETIADIQRQREMLASKRQAKLDFLQEVLSNRPQGKELALEFLRVQKRLTHTIGTLTPGPATGASFASHRRSLPWPTLGRLSAGFGQKQDPFSGTVTDHPGITLQAPYGTDIYAIFQGTVVFADWHSGFGQVVIVDHANGYHSVVAHLSKVEVRRGQYVEQLEKLGSVGDSGAVETTRLYFEIRREGRPQDPLTWLRPAP